MKNYKDFETDDEIVASYNKEVTKISNRIDKVLERYFSEGRNEDVKFLITQRALNLSITRSSNNHIFASCDFGKLIERVKESLEEGDLDE